VNISEFDIHEFKLRTHSGTKRQEKKLKTLIKRKLPNNNQPLLAHFITVCIH